MTASWREVSEGPLGLVPCRFFVQPMKVRQDECLLTSNIWVNSLWHFPFNTINGKFGWADWKKGAMNPVKNNQWCVTFREKVPFFYGIKYMIGYISLIFIIKIPLYYMWRLGNPTTVHIRLKGLPATSPSSPHHLHTWWAPNTHISHSWSSSWPSSHSRGNPVGGRQEMKLWNKQWGRMNCK